MLLILAPI